MLGLGLVSVHQERPIPIKPRVHGEFQNFQQGLPCKPSLAACLLSAAHCRGRRPARRSQDLEVDCLFYSLTASAAGFERVAVVVVPNGTRLMFIDWSKPVDGALPAAMPVSPLQLRCLSYAFSWGAFGEPCVRNSEVQLPSGGVLRFHDVGAFAQSIYTPGANIWLDDYVDVLTVVCLMAEEERTNGRIGLLGLGAGTNARQLLQLLPSRRFLAWETSQAVLLAADSCGGLGSERMEVRCDDILSSTAGATEPLAAMVVDVAVDGGEGDGRLPQELETVEAWSGLLSFLAKGSRLVANMGSLSQGPRRASSAALALVGAAEQHGLQVWSTIYPGTLGKDGASSVAAGVDANLLILVGDGLCRDRWERAQKGRLQGFVRWVAGVVGIC
ncbi:unnamed protein product [Effrenium voratum]|nr:unnamed protein product [Effrenium voratum]